MQFRIRNTWRRRRRRRRISLRNTLFCLCWQFLDDDSFHSHLVKKTFWQRKCSQIWGLCNFKKPLKHSALCFLKRKQQNNMRESKGLQLQRRSSYLSLIKHISWICSSCWNEIRKRTCAKKLMKQLPFCTRRRRNVQERRKLFNLVSDQTSAWWNTTWTEVCGQDELLACGCVGGDQYHDSADQ